MQTLLTRSVVLLAVIWLSARGQQEVYVEPLQSVPAYAAPIRIATMSELAGLVAVASSEKSVKLYDTKTLAEHATLLGFDSPISALLFSRDGKRLLAAHANGHISSWDLNTRAQVKDLSVHTGGVIAIAELDQGWLLSAGIDRTLTITDLASGRELASVSRVQDEIASFIPLSDGKTGLLCTLGGWLRTLSLPRLTEARSTETKLRITALALGLDGKTLAVGALDGAIQIWDVESSVQRAVVAGQRARITSLAFDAKQRYLVAASTDSVIQILDASTGVILKAIPLEDGYVATLSFTGDDVLWAGTSGGFLKTWRLLAAPPDTDPPVITITNPPALPQGPVKVLQDSYEIRGTIGDKSNLKEVSVDGVLAAIEVADASAPEAVERMKTKAFTARVKLDSIGLNTFEVRALDTYGNAATCTVEVQRLSRDQVVEILSPPNNLETDKTSLQLQFRTWCEVASYQVQVNLVDMVDHREIRDKKEGAIFTEEIPLVVGYNQIQLAITSRTGERYSKTLGVSRKVLGTIAVGPTGKLTPKDRGPGPQRWAVIVGISEYMNKGIPALKYADRDAQAFADFLQKPEGGGYEADHMRILLNKDATLANLKEALIDFLANAIDKDLVIIYFAGHGAPDPARPMNLYLLTHDADPSRLGTTAFPMWDIQTVLTRHITAKKIVVFSDACHSGGISTDFAARGMNVTDSNLINQYLADLARTKDGMVVFTASAAGEVSQEAPELGHGVFTYYMLEGMKGEADLNNDYTVTVNELMQYVEEQVKRKTKGAQNPTRSQTTYDKDLTISLIAH